VLTVYDQLYGYSKIAKGEDITKAPKPGMFDVQVYNSHFPCRHHVALRTQAETCDVQGKFKRNKWQEFVDAGITKDQATAKYVEKYTDLKTKHGLKA
jgi:diazepam-binding inhibitor (GABA receptor modulating acyl-CoA-binding protein)